jgi:probable aminopeptidase NPEPL1
MSTHLRFVGADDAFAELADGAREGAAPPNLILVGRRERLLDDAVRACLPDAAAAVWPAMLEALDPGDAGTAGSTWAGEGDTARRVVACALPEVISRHNSPARPHAVAQLVRKHTPSGQDAVVVLALDEGAHAFAAGCAASRAFPIYQRKSGERPKERMVTVAFTAPDGPVSSATLDRVERAAEGIRLAQRLVDAPTSELDTEAFVDVARETALELDCEITVLEGEQLAHSGFGGLWGVGRAARRPPALVVLTHQPREPSGPAVAWLGKGIVYDTGGLSLKGKAHMPGMKADMGGAAAVIGAFAAAVRGGYPGTLHAVLCLAENAIGPEAVRPDDILTMYSGRTVEVNNTDAEGRLVLADGVAYTARHLNPDVIVDLATLTGAQLVATGRRHAAIVSDDGDLEQRCVEAGRASGDLVHPLPYAPEFFRSEFKSEVADMKNSVKDRMNAQSSCAGQFIREHLVDFDGAWLHVDIAGPSGQDERATGFGVALLLQLFGG